LLIQPSPTHEVVEAIALANRVPLAKDGTLFLDFEVDLP